MRLQEKLGGIAIKPPRNTASLDAKHALVKALGYDGACRPCKTAGGEEFHTPRGRKHAPPDLQALPAACAQIASSEYQAGRQVRNLKTQAATLLEGPIIAPQRPGKQPQRKTEK